MQMNTQGTPTKLSAGSAAPSKFRINATPQFFASFSDGIYSDKPRASMRELSCNAWDAMAAAGKKDVPFEVHIPTQFEPYFKVKDFGTGMKFVKGGCDVCKGTGILSDDLLCEECRGTGDLDTVMGLYCSYFYSSKQEDNEQIGGFGLGSKSPFAYTMSVGSKESDERGGFTVVNHYEGQTYFYTAFIGPEGYPSVRLDLTADTPDTPNGVEVTFPIAPKDVWEFNNAAESVFEFFEPRPIFNIKLNVHTPEYSVKSEKWGMRVVEQTVQGTGLRAIMGNVQYTVGNIDISRLSSTQHQMINLPIDLFFGIGELKPALSRESLQLDNKTIANILKALDLVQEGMMEEVKKTIDSCQTSWEARIKLSSLSEQRGVGSLINDSYKKGFFDGTYTNFSLRNDRIVVNELDYNNSTFASYRTNERRNRKPVKNSLFTVTQPATRSLALSRIADGGTKKDAYDFSISVNSNTVVILNDLKTTGDRYIKYFLQNDDMHGYTHALVVGRIEKQSIDRAMQDGEALINVLGNPPVFRTSELKVKYDPLIKAEREAKPRVPREKMTVRVLSSSQYIRLGRSNGWGKAWDKPVDLDDFNDPDTPKFYFEVEGQGDGSTSSGQYSARQAIEMVNTIKNSGLFNEIDGDTEIYGIKKGSKLLEDASFVPFRKYVIQELKKILTPQKKLELSLSARPFRNDWEYMLTYIAENPDVLPATNPVREFALVLTAAKKETVGDRNTNIMTVARVMGIHIDNTVDYNQMWSPIQELYPLLKFFHGRRSHYSATVEEKVAVIDYLRFTDDQRSIHPLVLSEIEVTTDEDEISPEYRDYDFENEEDTVHV